MFTFANRHNKRAKKIFEYVPGLTGVLGLAIKKADEFLGSRPQNVDSFMKSKGHLRVIGLSICREPIVSAFKTIANIATGGKFKKEQKKLNYDNVFHLFLIMTLENGETFSIEKNEFVKIVANPNRPGDCKSIQNKSKLNFVFNDVMKTAEIKFGNDFYRYDFVKFNCQRFLLNILNTAGIFELDSWIYQDFSSAISPHLRAIGGFVTDIAAIFGRIFGKSITF